MGLGLDCAEGKCEVCSGTATCSKYADGCRDCACLCGCHVRKVLGWLETRELGEWELKFIRRLIASSRECLTERQYGDRLRQIDKLERDLKQLALTGGVC